MSTSFHLEIVSAESALFSGLVQKVFVSGVLGDLEILQGHTPFLTALKPGPVWVVNALGQEEVFYISGGMLEVQPHRSSLLAEMAIRAQDVDEKEALEAKERAEQILSGQTRDFDYAEAQSQLLEAVAQLRALKKFRERGRN